MSLVGGNTVKSTENGAIGGCWNGGPVLKNATSVINRVHGPVPHGLQNCCRCRWFVSDASYLPVLHSQFNQISYRANQAANIGVELEQQIDSLEDECYFAETQDKLFNQVLLRHGIAPVFLQMDDQVQLIAGNAMFREMAKYEWYSLPSLDRIMGKICRHNHEKACF